MAMIGAQRHGGDGAAAPDVLIASARNPDGFEERLARFREMRDEAAAAHARGTGGAERACGEPRSAGAYRAELARQELRLEAAEPELQAGQAQRPGS